MPSGKGDPAGLWISKRPRGTSSPVKTSPPGTGWTFGKLPVASVEEPAAPPLLQ